MHNIDLNYVRKGGGNDITIVFLHYFGGSSNSWSAVTDSLADDFHCVSIDLCGFGHSPTTAWEVSVHEHAQYVTDLIKDLKIDRYVLVGHSMGGKIALYIAAKKTLDVTSLILVAPSPPTPEPMTETYRQKMLESYGNKLAIEELIGKITAKPLPEFLFESAVREHLQISEMGWVSWLEKGSREDISSFMPIVNSNLLVISGSKDPNFSSSYLRKEFTKYFPSATFKEIRNSGHLIPVEYPAELADLIQDFVKS
ncbi:alpha/beta fold hydrolase [Dyadobacter frigoris]|uniref:Alpha/beta hydrolase n=1 Tax=Dyadobacter frigoris TaxID=2576211 RepID=A0A4U6CX73_9BACT|nr:alpha/beta hydrolase [Dyadobacter frigoris]TKT89389.1 alpha/beta hydrolase [Dyadobacter frigoris]GLU55471.1 hydrolase [Dyadobacter frigoris]